MSITIKSDLTDMHRCPYCGRNALAAACAGKFEDWDQSPDGQWYHKSCKGTSKRIADGISMYGRIRREAGKPVWEVE